MGRPGLGLGSGLGPDLGLGTGLGTRPVGLGSGLGTAGRHSVRPAGVHRAGPPARQSPAAAAGRACAAAAIGVVVLLPGCERVLPVREGMPGRLAARVAAAALVMG